jgi:hypothetical protein
VILGILAQQSRPRAPQPLDSQGLKQASLALAGIAAGIGGINGTGHDPAKTLDICH